MRVAEKRPSAGGVCSPSAPCARKFITRRGRRHYILANKQINSAARASFGLRCLRAGGAGCGLLPLFTHPCVKWSSSSSSALRCYLIWVRSPLLVSLISQIWPKWNSPRRHAHALTAYSHSAGKHSTARYTAICQLLVHQLTHRTACKFSNSFPFKNAMTRERIK